MHSPAQQFLRGPPVRSQGTHALRQWKIFQPISVSGTTLTYCVTCTRWSADISESTTTASLSFEPCDSLPRCTFNIGLRFRQTLTESICTSDVLRTRRSRSDKVRIDKHCVTCSPSATANLDSQNDSLRQTGRLQPDVRDGPALQSAQLIWRIQHGNSLLHSYD